MQSRLIKAAAVAMCACLVTGVLAIIPDSAQGAGKAAAIVTFVKGKVQLKRAGSEKYEKLKVNTMLYEGDAVRVKRWARAGLVLSGGAEVRLNSNSYFELVEGGKDQKVKMSLGQIWTKMLHKMARLNVHTPTAVIAVRGTEADVEMRKIMTVKVYEGEVDVMNDYGKQSLTAGQVSRVADAASAPSAPREMKQSEYETWQGKIKVKDIDKFIEMLKAEMPDEKTLEFDIEKGDEIRKTKVKLKKE